MHARGRIDKNKKFKFDSTLAVFQGGKNRDENSGKPFARLIFVHCNMLFALGKKAYSTCFCQAKIWAISPIDTRRIYDNLPKRSRLLEFSNILSPTTE